MFKTFKTFNRSAHCGIAPFQTFQSFKRGASFKPLRRKTEWGIDLFRTATDAVICIGFSRRRNALVCVCSITRSRLKHGPKRNCSEYAAHCWAYCAGIQPAVARYRSSQNAPCFPLRPAVTFSIAVLTGDGTWSNGDNGFLFSKQAATCGDDWT